VRGILRAATLLALLAPLVLPGATRADPALDPTGSPWLASATGPYPTLDPLVIFPAPRGHVAAIFSLASNAGAQDFTGDLLIRVPEAGVDDSIHAPMKAFGQDGFLIATSFLPVPADAPADLHVSYSFAQDGQAVGHGESRTVAVPDGPPCPGRVSVVQSAGAKDVPTGGGARYAYVLCNGTGRNETVDVSFRDLRTGRPLVSDGKAFSVLARSDAGRLAGLDDAADPYHVVVPAGAMMGMLFTLEDASPPAEIDPVATLGFADGSHATTGPLDPVTFAAPRLA